MGDESGIMVDVLCGVTFGRAAFRDERTGRRRAGCAGCSAAAAPPEGAQSVESSS